MTECATRNDSLVRAPFATAVGSPGTRLRTDARNRRLHPRGFHRSSRAAPLRPATESGSGRATSGFLAGLRGGRPSEIRAPYGAISNQHESRPSYPPRPGRSDSRRDWTCSAQSLSITTTVFDGAVDRLARCLLSSVSAFCTLPVSLTEFRIVRRECCRSSIGRRRAQSR